MSLKRRHCINHQDKPKDIKSALKVETTLLKQYHYGECQAHCQAKLMETKCKCVPYYLQDIAHQWQLNKSCDSSGITCLAMSSGEWQQ